MKDEEKIEEKSQVEEEGPEVSQEEISRLTLIVALLIMMLPAAIPLYFALGADDGEAVLFFLAVTLGVVVVNVILVFALWKWLKSLRS